jgi:signal peptidase II
MGRTRRAVIFVAVFVITVLADQGSKVWARTLPVAPADCTVPDDLVARRCAGVPQPVIEGVWDWELAFNTGAAFSSFTGSQIVLSALALVALIGLGIAAARTQPEQGLRRLAYATIAGGALGNLIDRLRDGAVTDFVRWRAGEHAWPIFNVADVALVAGVGLLFVAAALEKRRAPA